MNTDQLGQRLKISGGLLGFRLKNTVRRLLQFGLLYLMLTGAYLLLAPAWGRLHAIPYPVPAPLDAHWLAAEPMGNVILIAAGAAAIWATT